MVPTYLGAKLMQGKAWQDMTINEKVEDLRRDLLNTMDAHNRLVNVVNDLAARVSKVEQGNSEPTGKTPSPSKGA